MLLLLLCWLLPKLPLLLRLLRRSLVLLSSPSTTPVLLLLPPPPDLLPLLPTSTALLLVAERIPKEAARLRGGFKAPGCNTQHRQTQQKHVNTTYQIKFSMPTAQTNQNCSQAVQG